MSATHSGVGATGFNSSGVKLLSRAARVVAWILGRAKCVSNVDLSAVIPTEALLNLSGSLPIFCTAVTAPGVVLELLRRLHPVDPGRPLIRLGPAADGGYLIPDDFSGLMACFSAGVGDVAGFESDCAQRGLAVFMADGSVPGPPIQHSRFRFTRNFIGPFTEGPFLSLEDWVTREAAHLSGDLLLQMDIEGAEYEVLLSAPPVLLERFRIIVIEFHYLDRLFSQPLFAMYRMAFEKILRTHTCVHIHPNNVCRTLSVAGETFLQMAEFTFIRNDRIRDRRSVTTFPHPLDRDNTGNASCLLPRAYHVAS